MPPVVNICSATHGEKKGESYVKKKNLGNSLGLHFTKTYEEYTCLTAAQELLYTGEEQ